ncbi:MAG: hypothetical protein U0931_05045 [Vulcanimicrobiota bacterium]
MDFTSVKSAISALEQQALAVSDQFARTREELRLVRSSLAGLVAAAQRVPSATTQADFRAELTAAQSLLDRLYSQPDPPQLE